MASVKRLVFSSARNKTIDMNKKYIYNTTIKYTINTIQETSIQYNVRLTTMGKKQFSMAIVYLVIIQKSRLTRDER